MLTDPLPTTLDVRKAAMRGASTSGALKPLDLPRFRALLASDEGAVQAQLAFSRDEEGRFLVTVETDSELWVECQRCLGAMPLQLHTSNTLAAVWSDEQARNLPRMLEPLLLEAEECELWELVEDELILGLPPYNYHDREDCSKELVDLSAAEAPAGEEASRPNPFEVLAQLKPGEKD